MLDCMRAMACTNLLMTQRSRGCSHLRRTVVRLGLQQCEAASSIVHLVICDVPSARKCRDNLPLPDGMGLICQTKPCINAWPQNIVKHLLSILPWEATTLRGTPYVFRDAAESAFSTNRIAT